MPYNSLLRPIVVTNSTHCQQGPVGPRGKQGLQGIQGKPGDQGIQGIAGTPGTNAPTLPDGEIGFGGIGKLVSSPDLTFDNGILSVKNIKFGKVPISYKIPTRALDSELNAILAILDVLTDLGLMHPEEENDGQ